MESRDAYLLLGEQNWGQERLSEGGPLLSCLKGGSQALLADETETGPEARNSMVCMGKL